MIKIYGSPASSAGRCFWMLEEAGVPYEHMPLNMRNKEHKSSDFIKLNPNGKVPVLIDGDLVLWESVAINNYLAEKYVPSLIPANILDRASMHKWSLWALLELQPPLIDLFIQFNFVPEENRNLDLIEKAKAILPSRLAILNSYLKDNVFLAGAAFSVADINMGTVVAIAPLVGESLESYPEIQKWQSRLADRPAFARYMKLHQSRQSKS